MFKSRALGVLTFLSLLAIPAISEATLIGVGWDYDNGPVVSITESNGDGAFIGNSGFSNLNALAANSTGILYSTSDSKLITINPLSGAGSFAANLSFVPSVLPDIRGLAFSPSNVLFAVQNGSQSDLLYSIDTSSGAGSLIGSMGFRGVQGMDFSPSGSLYAWDVTSGLLQVNTSTGAASAIGSTVSNGGGIQTIVFGSGGNLYGARDALYTINQSTGQLTLVGSDGYENIRGLEYVYDGSNTLTTEYDVPEPVTGLLIGSGIAMLAFLRRRAG